LASSGWRAAPHTGVQVAICSFRGAHALKLLFHLPRNGSASHRWAGVPQILAAAGVKEIPKDATAVFVGNEFDSVKGRCGDDGTPLRKTPWAGIAWQLGLSAGSQAAEKNLALVAEHDKTKTAPGGEVIRQLFSVVQASSLHPSSNLRHRQDARPTPILLDELMNCVSRNRKNGLGAQLYNSLPNLSEGRSPPFRLAFAPHPVLSPAIHNLASPAALRPDRPPPASNKMQIPR